MQYILEETALTQHANEPVTPEPQPEIAEQTSTTPPEPETQEEEATALVTPEPDVIEGEVVELEPKASPEAYTPPQQKPYWLLIPFAIVLCLLFLAGSYLLPLFTPTATVTIIPVEKSLSLTTAIQVHGRLLPALTLSQSQTMQATGNRHQDATRAAGTITFYNGLLSSQTIAAGTILTGNDGIQVVTDQAAIIPAGNPPIYGQVTVPAHAVDLGSGGNIAAYDINTACCATSVVAKNTTAFTGGESARDVRIVTRTDINTIVTTLLVTLSQSDSAALQAQLHPGEALITSACTPHVSSDHKTGDEAKQVTVTVSETCGATAYDAHEVYASATQMIHEEATRRLGTGFLLMGDVTIRLLHATIVDAMKGIATITIQADATYVYQLTPRVRQHIITLIAGKTNQQATATLLQFPGIQAASIHLTGGNTTLPADPHLIHIIVRYQTS